MKRRIFILTTVGAVYGSQKVFNIHDDLLAFPQYEVIFSDEYISKSEADSLLSLEPLLLQTDLNRDDSTIVQDEITSQELLQTELNDDTLVTDSSEESQILEGYERLQIGATSYLCVIPQAIESVSANETTDQAGKNNEEKELVRATHRGWELLKDMEGHCMYFVGGWWSYSFCYNNEVRQFHALPPGRGGVPNYPPVEDKRVDAYTLGQFGNQNTDQRQLGDGNSGADAANPASQKDISIQTRGDMRYIVQNLTGGTLCDLTGKPRKVEVQFHCHPQSSDRIGWIKETATCSYLMVIYTPRLCNDVAFLPPKETQAHQIVCKEVVKEGDIQELRAEKIAGSTGRLVNENSNEPARPVVGGIVVGGMKQVGQDGKRIAPPKPIQHAEENGEVLAKWDPDQSDKGIQKLPDSALRKLDLDPLVVKEMRDELHKRADGRAWKLEVVDVGRGLRELHGIVEGDDDLPEDEGHGEYFDERAENDARDDDSGEGSHELFKDEL